MAKNKVKLNNDQRVWLSNLEWYLCHKICWVGDSLDNLKEIVVDGKYALLFGDSTQKSIWENFNTIICTDTIESAEVIEKWTPSSLCRIVNLETLWVEKEVRNIHSPYFSTLVEKWDYDKQIARYKELKKSLKPVLKKFGML